MMPGNLTFLKLGGSLITYKERESSVNLPVLRSACEQIVKYISENPGKRLLLGHGSGSFGHHAAAKYGTRRGFNQNGSANEKQAYWNGFIDVYQQARALNQIVMKELHTAGVNAISFPPNSSVIADAGKVDTWDNEPIATALQHNIVPVIYGDVIFDRGKGGTILSTEELFEDLALRLHPNRILLAGIEEGVWADFPNNQTLISKIETKNISEISASLTGSSAVDVTGGMDSKVRQMLILTEKIAQLQVRIFSGIPENNIYYALNSSEIGTLITR